MFMISGPDEQVIPDDINWIVRRAKQRGYWQPNTFMSSKPDAGMSCPSPYSNSHRDWVFACL